MIRGTVHVHDPIYLTDVYEMLENFDDLDIVRLENRLSSDVQKVTVTMIYSDAIIVEVVIKSGTKPVNYYSNQFLNEVTRCETPLQFRNLIT